MVNQTIVLKIENEILQRALENIICAIPGYTIETDVSNPCSLLIFEITDKNPDEQFDYIMRAMSSGMAGHLFLMSGANDPDVLVQALKFYPKKFFPLPLNHEDLKNALTEFQVQSAGDGRTSADAIQEGTIIHVIGSKGGVGTTTIAVNLAMGLIRANKSVALVDMNPLFGDIPIFLGMESPQFCDWIRIARNFSRLTSSMFLEALYKHPSGLRVLSSPVNIFDTFNGGPEIIKRIFGIMKTMFDYVVIDGGKDLDLMSKSVIEVADSIIVVTLLNNSCLANVNKLRETFQGLGYLSDDRVSILANRADDKPASISREDAERIIKKKIVWAVPNDFQNTMHSIDTGKTLIETVPTRDVTKEILKIAAFFCGDQIVKQSTLKKRLLSRLHPVLVERYT